MGCRVGGEARRGTSGQGGGVPPGYVPWALHAGRLGTAEGAEPGMDVTPGCPLPTSRCWILGGLTCTPQHWRRSAAFAKPWTRGSMRRRTTWWCCTTRLAGPHPWDAQ